jgi:hypothetical protein
LSLRQSLNGKNFEVSSLENFLDMLFLIGVQLRCQCAHMRLAHRSVPFFAESPSEPAGRATAWALLGDDDSGTRSSLRHRSCVFGFSAAFEALCVFHGFSAAIEARPGQPTVPDSTFCGLRLSLPLVTRAHQCILLPD